MALITGQDIIPFAKTGIFPPLVLDYLSGQPSVRHLYRFPPTGEGMHEAVVKRAEHASGNRQVLASALALQYAGVRPIAAVSENIKQLLQARTFAVTTGHQPCLFLGPAYFIYKIVSVINLARELSRRQPANHFVPVFWMQTEDHDLKEVSSVGAFGRDWLWAPGVSGPAGRLPVTNLLPVLGELKTVLAGTRHGHRIYDIFAGACKDSRTLAETTRYVLHELFGEYGLLVLDPDDKALKRTFIKTFSEDIFNGFLSEAVKGSIKTFNEKFHIQAEPREINVLYMKGNERGSIKRQGADYGISGNAGVFSEAQIRQELESFPERFSPNVLLRPLYQETILPGVCYVGGPSEMAYWLELKNAFEAGNVFYPVLMPRNSVFWLETKKAKTMKDLGLQALDFFLSRNDLVMKYLETGPLKGFSLEVQRIKLQELIVSLVDTARRMDPTLGPYAEARGREMEKIVLGIEERIRRGAGRKEEIALRRIEDLKETLFPGGDPQERSSASIEFLARYGEEWIKDLLQRLDPFTGGVYMFSAGGENYEANPYQSGKSSIS